MEFRGSWTGLCGLGHSPPTLSSFPARFLSGPGFLAFPMQVSPLSTISKCCDAGGNPLSLFCMEASNGLQGRGAKEHFCPGSEQCQGLGWAPKRRNSARFRRVGRKDGACHSCFPLLLFRASLHWFDLSVHLGRGHISRCGIPL